MKFFFMLMITAPLAFTGFAKDEVNDAKSETISKEDDQATATKFSDMYSSLQKEQNFMKEQNFYIGSDYDQLCKNKKKVYWGNEKNCVEAFNTSYISQPVLEHVMKECVGKWTAKDRSSCIVKYTNRSYPEAARKGCMDLSMDECTEKFKNDITYPFEPARNPKIKSALLPSKPSINMVDEIEKNLKAGNYAKAKSLLNILAPNDDGCTSTLEVNDTHMDKLNDNVIKAVEKTNKNLSK